MEREADAALGVELGSPHQIDVVQSTGFLQAAGKNVIEAIAVEPVFGDGPDGFIAQRDESAMRTRLADCGTKLQVKLAERPAVAAPAAVLRAVSRFRGIPDRPKSRSAR